MSEVKQEVFMTANILGVQTPQTQPDIKIDFEPIERFRKHEKKSASYKKIRGRCFPLDHDQEQFDIKDPLIKYICSVYQRWGDEWVLVSCAEAISSDKNYFSVENVMTHTNHRGQKLSRFAIGGLLWNMKRIGYRWACLTCLPRHTHHYEAHGFKVAETWEPSQ